MAQENSPRSSLPWWLAAIAAVGGIVVLNAPKESPPAKPTAEPSKADEAKAEPADREDSDYDPLRLVREYVRFEPARAGKEGTDPAYRVDLPFRIPLAEVRKAKTQPPAPPDLPAALARFRQLDPNPDPVQFEFLIATVPDPIDSKLALEFDAVVNGLQRAYETRGFTLHSSLLPWPRAGKPPASNQAKGKPPPYRENPGTLLFRRTRTEEDNRRVLAVVCLVGENPLSGVQKPALYRALQAYEDLNYAVMVAPAGWSRNQAADIPIAGPYFSGSQSRLVDTLRAWVRDADSDGGWWGLPLRFNVISGNATALEPGLFPNFPGTIRATVVPYDLVRRAVLNYLAGDRSDDLPGGEPDAGHPVAILRESNTGFGSRLDRSRGAKEDRPDAGRRPVMDLPFPASISQLKAEWEKELHPAPGANLPRVELVEPPLKSRDRTDLDLDGVPPYDRGAAATVAGQTLRSILTVVERSGVRYVGITATDNRDVVFLHKLIRERCPNVRVFTTEPSVAFTHPDDAYALRGMVVGSTYPLHPAASWWTGEKDESRHPVDNRVLPFPTQGSQGYYNAVLALTGDRLDRMIGYRPLSFNGEARPGRPPIWVSVVGQGGTLVPVHRYNGYENPAGIVHTLAGGDPRPTTPPHAVTPPFGILFGAAGAVAAVWYLATGLVRRWLWARWALGRTRADRADRVRPAPWQWWWRGLLLAAVLLFAVPYTLPVVELFTPPRLGLPPGFGLWRHAALLAAGGAILAGIGVLVVRLFGRAAGPGASRADRIGYTCLAWVAVAAVAFAWLVWGVLMSRAERFFVYVRAADFPAGMSPLVPMMLTAAAAGLAAWFHLKQADLARRPWLRRPYPRVWRRVRGADQRLVDDIRRPGRFARVWTRRFWRAAGGTKWVVVGLWAGFLLAAVWYAADTALPSGERTAWDRVMWAALWLTGGVVVFTLARFLVLWSRLGRLLEELTRVPMVGAFERLPYEVGRLFGGYLYSFRPRHTQLAAVAWALPVPWRERLAEDIARERPGLAWVFGRPAAGPPAAAGAVVVGAAGPGGVVAVAVELPALSDERWLIRWLRRRCRTALAALPGWWAKQPVDHAFGVGEPHDKGDQKEKESPAAGPEPAAAGRHGRGRTPPASEPAAGPPAVPAEAEQEQFVACYVVMYLGAYFAQLRMLVYALAAAAPLLLLAAASYPFQPDRPRLDAVAALLIAVAVGTAYVLYKINRDGLVSRISRTAPHRFTPDTGFITSIAQFVLPVLLVVAAQLFGLFRFILEPVFGLFQ